MAIVSLSRRVGHDGGGDVSERQWVPMAIVSVAPCPVSWCDRMSTLRRAKFWLQRQTRGWDDSETWSLDTTIARFVYPRIKRFRELKAGYPMGLTPERWDDILGKIEQAFGIMSIKQGWEMTINESKAVDLGLRLFGKYFRDLWW